MFFCRWMCTNQATESLSTASYGEGCSFCWHMILIRYIYIVFVGFILYLGFDVFFFRSFILIYCWSLGTCTDIYICHNDICTIIWWTNYAIIIILFWKMLEPVIIEINFCTVDRFLFVGCAGILFRHWLELSLILLFYFFSFLSFPL